MQVAVGAAVLKPELKVTYKPLGDYPWEVKIESLGHTPGDDCVYVTCTYPGNEIKVHQLFLTDKIEKLLFFMVQTFRGVYNTGVMPTLPIPKINELSGAVIKFVKG